MLVFALPAAAAPPLITDAAAGELSPSPPDTLALPPAFHYYIFCLRRRHAAAHVAMPPLNTIFSDADAAH